jgi:hypothetical protein
MKNFWLTLSCCLAMLAAAAQDSIRAVPVDKSPMDMSYFPDQYPLLKFQGKAPATPLIRIIYGRPQKDGRTIFGELIQYGEVWRIGANEATEIEFYKDATIGGKKVVKGRYTLYCIPTATDWTFIINKDTDTWGAFKYDSKKDVVRVKVKATPMATVVEALSLSFQKTATGANLLVSWDKMSAKLPITI